MKMKSAKLSYLIISLSFLVLIDKKENKQLAISSTLATPVISSIFDISLSFDILSEVKTTRQNPSRLEEVFKICCDLLFAIILKINRNSVILNLLSYFIFQIYTLIFRLPFPEN